MIGPEAPRVSGAGAREVSIRPLLESDLDALVALDARTTGVRRLAYFERRRAAAIRAPREPMPLAATSEGRVVGWVLARLAGGQYGRTEVRLVLESLGVDPGIQRAGIGARLLARLDELASARGIGSIVTQVDWRNHSMLHFLDRAGFRIACTHVLARGVDRVGPEDAEPPPNVCRALRHDDLESLVRIDAALTGTPRPEYFRRQVEEALHESAIAVSLVAEADGLPVAFAMARVDLGDYGRIASVASLDTLGVVPGFARRGYGRALLTQMIDNLSALRIDRLETEAARDDFDLLRFFYRAGFQPSSRIPFERSTSPGKR